MQLKYAITGAVIIAALVISNFYFITQSKQLAQQNTVLTDQITTTKKHNIRLIDSLTKVSVYYSALVSSKTEKTRVLESQVDSILNEMHAHEKTIDALHNADSIYLLFARYYPNNITTSQSGN